MSSLSKKLFPTGEKEGGLFPFGKLIGFLLLFLLSFGSVESYAQQRRPIDSKHPAWLVHVDVWNQADPQKIINLIPDDIKPYVILNLSLSCAYDTKLNIHQRPQNAIRTYKSWATICQQNNMWFTLQPASGGHTHIHENDLETFEYFFKKFPNFLGWNYAEQFWGFDQPGDLFSSSQAARIALFAKLVPMHHKYGGFLTVSFCGNKWSHPLNPVGMLKRNADLLQASRDYPEAILWLYKYTTSSCFYNNESVCFGPFVSGLTKNYGVRYDNCGWNGALEAILGENHGKKYPVAAGIGTVMEQTCQNGGAVWDGPELIWTEDFRNLNNTTVNGYTQRNWGTFPGFRNIWIDMFRKIIDGTLYIPTQQEVIDKTKIIIVNDIKEGEDEDKYATWGNLYDGLYKQTDPFNRGNGQWMDNFWYLKKTGRYGTIPMTPTITEIASGIPTKVKKSQRSSVWPSIAKKTEAFDAAYPEVSTGDLFVSRYKNQLVTYTPYTYLNQKITASANIPLQYNTCKSLDLKYGKLSSGLIREYADSITLYLNNYRADTIKNVEDIIVVNGAKSEPSFEFTKRAEAKVTAEASWDAETNAYTLKVSHNGPVDIKIVCAGNETDRRTDMVNRERLEIPKQPEPYAGEIIIEAEDMNYRSVGSCEVTPYYSSYQWVRGQAGNGFIVTGTNTSAALTCKVRVPKAGQYTAMVRYNNTSRDCDVRLRINSNVALTASFKKTERNEWKKAGVTFDLNEGENTFYLFNTSGTNMFIDQVIFTPVEQEAEKFDINIHETADGTAIPNVAAAAEGETVTLTPQANEGCSIIGWNIIHGNITLNENEDGTFSFTMPDDIVTLEPIFKDTAVEYALSFDKVANGGMPEGWRADDGTMHQYPNTYSSGPRTFKGFTGAYNAALYWRTNSADYGNMSAYPLTLAPGNYRLSYVMAAWVGAPEYKAQILTSAGKVVAETGYTLAQPNIERNQGADMSSAEEHTLEFTIPTEGNYVIKFQNNGTGFSEFLLLACKIKNLNPAPTSIDDLFLKDVDKEGLEIFTIDGKKIPTLQHGINIIRRNGFDVKKVYVK